MRRDVQEMDERVKAVSFQSRDTRMVGCTGDAQIVISNPRTRKADHPCFQGDRFAGRCSLASFFCDVASSDHGYSSRSGRRLGRQRRRRPHATSNLPDTRETPEEDLLRNEAEIAAAGFRRRFLKT